MVRLIVYVYAWACGIIVFFHIESVGVICIEVITHILLAY